MKFYLDSAIYEEIAEAVKWGVIDGVTTNPTLIAKAGRDHEEQVKRICGIVGNVSAEVVSEKADDMIVEGRRIAKWHPNVIVKVPLTVDGLTAGKVLASEGDINADGMRVVADIVSAYRQQDIKTKVLAASMRHPMHITQAALAGADIATMPFSVLKQLFNHPLTDAGQKKFLEDYRKTQEAKPVKNSAEAAAKR